MTGQLPKMSLPRTDKVRRNVAIVTLIVVAVFVLIRLPARAGEATVDLKSAAAFAVLAGTTVTNTGPSKVNGELGVSPGSSITGFGPGIVTNGTIHSADATAATAQSHLTAAYNDAAGRNCPLTLTNQLTGQDLGGLTLKTGVYCYTSSAQLTGTVTFDAEGVPGAVFIIQIGSTLTTAPSATVALLNGADPCNIFWQVGSSATLDTNTTFIGNILALTSITLNTGATAVNGRMLARNGAVTMDTNTIDRGTCAAAAATSTPTATAGSSATPVPTSAPTATPAATASPAPTAAPTAAPTSAPTASPVPTAAPTAAPTSAPTASPVPTAAPTATPTPPIVIPLATPTPTPTSTSTSSPVTSPTPTATPPVLIPLVTASPKATPTARPTPTTTSSVTLSVIKSPSIDTGTARPTLPRTGAEIGMFVLLALGLIAGGELLRQWARAAAD